MPGEMEQPEVPLWAAAKAKKQIDVVREVSRALAEVERNRALQPVDALNERDLEVEQLRLEEMLHAETMTVADFKRLREVDFFLEAMQERRRHGASPEHWLRESRSE